MLAGYAKENRYDENNNPTGGSIAGTGLKIIWQNGPLGREKKEPNGAFVETVIDAAKSRLEFYQGSKFACDYNAQAIKALENALWILNQRTANREMRGVEGEHKE